MPALSPTMTSGTLAKWKKSIGDSVNPGDVLAEIETDKATMEWECQEEGYIANMLFPNGEKDVPVGKQLLVLVEDKNDIEAIPKDILENASGENASAPQPENPISENENTETKKDAGVSGSDSAPDSAEASQLSMGSIQNNGADSKTNIRNKIKISPLARKIASENNIDISALNINGSGPGGRIVENDILSLLSQHKTPPASSIKSETGTAVNKPLTNMRKTIAKRLAESTSTIPHFSLTCKVNMNSVVAIRSTINKRFAMEKPGAKLSINDFIIKATAIALKEFPSVNSSWMGDSIREYPNVDISVAVSTGDGLITPIIFNADKLGLLSISSEVKRLAAKAKNNALVPEEFVGGTFTISNLGMYGISSFTAIINPPQSAILAVGATETVWKPISELLLDNDSQDAKLAESEDKLVPCSEMSLTLSCDHRVVDGALGAMFLQKLKNLLEEPAQMLL